MQSIDVSYIMDYVNQKATSSEKMVPKGRPIAFDRGEVIDRAVEMFWTKGFDGSSLDDLVGGLGISRSTLYNSFDGKDGLHESALDRYLERVERVIVEPLRNGTEGVADLLAFIDLVGTVLAATDMPAGCLVLNEIAASRNTAAVDRYLNGMRDAVGASLSRAAMLGEIDQSTVTARTAVVLAAVIGANHVAHAATDAHATDLIDGLRTVVGEWV